MSPLISPCIRNCCLDDDNICLGCFRSLDEILLWGCSETSIDKKQHILDQAKKRKYLSRQALS